MPLTATIKPSRRAHAAASTSSRAPPGVTGLSVAIHQPGRGTAFRTGVRLRVEPAVAGVVVFLPASGAHLEPGHGGERAVVRHSPHDREARAAIGAVDERVPEPPVRRIEQLGEAIGAGGAVRRDERVRLARALARDDLESRLRSRRDSADLDPLDQRQRRRLARQSHGEAIERAAVALHLDQHPALVVQHEAVQPELVGQPEDVGAEADSLHDSLDAHAQPAWACGRRDAHLLASTRSRSTWYALA